MGNRKSTGPDKSMPSNMILIYARARAYQQYISGLKSGKKSGISQMFGSAEDLFSDDVELPPTPKVDVAAVELGTQEESQWRSLYLVDQLQLHSNNMMKDHVGRCRSGSLGQEAMKAAKSKVDGETIKIVMKEVCSLYVYLIAIEQGVFESDAPEWLQEFFGRSVSVTDMEMPGRSVDEIMSGFDYCEVGKLSQKLASSIGKHLGFGAVGEVAWNDLRKRILSDGMLRFELFERSLSLPLSDIKDHFNSN